jgi:flagellar biosynthesis/type III secretory pathway protein FliH
MFRQQVLWSTTPIHVRVRGHAAGNSGSPRVACGASGPVPASFPNETGQSVSVAVPGPPDIRPVLDSIAAALEEVELRRQQSLGELQQVAIELALAVASQLTFSTISREEHAVEELVGQAVRSLGLGSGIVLSLHPADLDQLNRRLAQQPAPAWKTTDLSLRGDPSVARGGCRIESPDGRMLVSDLSTRLSEIRRHWMEELDDAQVERRGPAGEGKALRRFPDRRETA